MDRDAKWLKRTRIAAGYPKQEAFASAMGVSRSAVGNWEAEGSAGRPDSSQVPKLARLLGVSQAEVIERLGIRMQGRLEEPADPTLAALREQTGLLREILAEMRRASLGQVVTADEMMRALGMSTEPGSPEGTPSGAEPVARGRTLPPRASGA